MGREELVMRNGNPLLLGAGRYIQAEDALSMVGLEAKRLGKKAFVIGGETALSLSLQKIRNGLRDEGIECSVHPFKGLCTKAQIARISEEAMRFGADFVIGVGGGKSLDTAKAVAGTLDQRVITVPTSAATCAAYATFSVIYSDAGEVLENMFHKHEAAAVIADMDVIARKCPSHMLASGIGDAFAKYPEIAYSMAHCDEMERSALPGAGMKLAEYNAKSLLEKGKNAFYAVGGLNISQDIEDTVCTNITLTGVVSALVSGGKQLAVAHSFYNAICAYFGDIRKGFLHGELVSAAIPLQLAVNGAPDEEIQSTRDFLRSIRLPVSFQDVQLECTEKNLESIAKYISDSIGIQDETARKHLRKCMETVQ